MINYTEKPKKCWVVFKDSELDHWFLNRLDEHFRHCLIFFESSGGTLWVEIDPKGGNISVNTYAKDSVNIRMMYPNAVIIETWTKPNNIVPYRIWHINCVEVVKRFLGVDDWKIITPYQLYKHLRK